MAPAAHRLHLQAEVHPGRDAGPPAQAGGGPGGHRRPLSRGPVLPLRHHGGAAGILGEALQAPEGAGGDPHLPRSPRELPLLEPPRSGREAHGGGDDLPLHQGSFGKGVCGRGQRSHREGFPVRRLRLAKGKGNPGHLRGKGGGPRKGPVSVPPLRRGVPDEDQGHEAFLRELREGLGDERAKRASRGGGGDGVLPHPRLVRVGARQRPPGGGGRDLRLHLPGPGGRPAQRQGVHGSWDGHPDPRHDRLHRGRDL